ncbi:TY-Chap domain-containing protein [Streptomyces sp. NPDC051561]|uniref:TY-Chap domain-containing protein n=1 Tax=Streptomyces sp. NPDC051561 TaxID=3365658 RepID=UPI0037B74B24
MTDWSGFREGLAEQLTTLAGGSTLIIGEGGAAARFAQFRQSSGSLSAELVGDHYLGPSVRAGEAGSRLISEAGWLRPEDTAYGHNWHTELPWPSDSAAYRRLAAMTVTGLRDGLGIAGPDELVYRAWTRGNRDLRLPLLGLIAQS